ncbi:MAG: hypothetical protein GY699_16020 [Desulfobacteraceae bacterium]|nr:hypothetical protein [Desulfobacteraceae bacterium]
MSKKLTFSLIACLLIVGIYSQAYAALVQWEKSLGGNGHYYEYVRTGNSNDRKTWNAAKEAAEARSTDVLWAHLATIKKVEENDFVFALRASGNDPKGAWLGGFQELDGNITAYSPSSSWEWVDDGDGDGEDDSFGYTNWKSGEPNDGGGGENNQENFLVYDYYGKWNDVPDGPRWYIVEYEAYPTPIPASAWLLGSGILGIIGYRRKLKSNV